MSADRPTRADRDALRTLWTHWSGPATRLPLGWRHPVGPIPLALDDALWLDADPDPSADAPALPPDLDLLVAPGDAAEPRLTSAGYRPWLAVRADDPFAAGGPLVATERVPVHEVAPRRWDAAHDVARRLLSDAGASEPSGDARRDDARGDDRDDAEALATALAAASEANDAVGLHLSHDASAAAVSLRTPEAFVVLAAGAASDGLVARLLAEARATGRIGYWTRTCALDDPGAWLRRWSAAP